MIEFAVLFQGDDFHTGLRMDADQWFPACRKPGPGFADVGRKFPAVVKPKSDPLQIADLDDFQCGNHQMRALRGEVECECVDPLAHFVQIVRCRNRENGNIDSADFHRTELRVKKGAPRVVGAPSIRMTVVIGKDLAWR